MVNLTDIAGQTRDVASALHVAQEALKSVERLLAERTVDQALTERLSDVESFGRSANQVSRSEQEAGAKRLTARSEEPRAIAESDDADAALGAAFRDSQGKAGSISRRLKEPWQDLAELRDRLHRSSDQLKNVRRYADALDRTTEYEGPKDQLANVDGVKEIVDEAAEGVEEAAARIDTARTIASRFELDPPAIKSGQLAHEATSMSNRLHVELSTAQTMLRELGAPIASKKDDVAKVTDQAIDASDTAKDAARAEKKAAAALAKNMQAGTTPRPASGRHAEASQHSESSGQQDLHRRLGGKAQDSEVQR